MGQVLASDRVRLQEDIPELELFKGDVGVVVSSWFCPNTAYEVEFRGSDRGFARRVLLLEQQIAQQ